MNVVQVPSNILLKCPLNFPIAHAFKDFVLFDKWCSYIIAMITSIFEHDSISK